MLTLVPLTWGGTLTVAQAQERVSVEFRTALEPYGRWESHRRWGDVWVPARTADDWRPYKRGRWSYTRDWGWYWVSDEDFGWIVYHYGRWFLDPDLGWVWVPGREWGPAYVQWRRGGTHVGWAPLPPEEVIVEYRDEPDVWLFVRSRDFLAPRIAVVILPERRFDVYVRQTVFVNRTVIVSERGPSIAVNPGIEPAIVASFVGRPVRTYNVQPRVLAGTRGVEGAVTVSAEDIRTRRGNRSALREAQFLKQTQDVVRPAQRVPEPQPLAAEEKGRLGDTPPRAARAEADRETTTGTAPRQSSREAEPSKDGARGDEDRAKRDARRDRDDARAKTKDGDRDASSERQRPGRDARELSKEERREAQEELKRERRDAREQKREAKEPSQDRRSGAREQAREKQEQAREKREQAREKRQEMRREKRDAREDARQELRRERQDAREQRRGRPAATEGRSPPDEGRRSDRGPGADRDGPRAAPRERGPRPDVGRSAPAERPSPPATSGAAPREAGPPARGLGGGGGRGGPGGKPGERGN